MGGAHGHADRNLVSFGDHVVDAVTDVGADVAYPPDNVLEPIDAVPVFWDGRVIVNVRAMGSSTTSRLPLLWTCAIKPRM